MIKKSRRFRLISRQISQKAGKFYSSSNDFVANFNDCDDAADHTYARDRIGHNDTLRVVRTYDLPLGLQSCKNLVDIIVQNGKRLQRQRNQPLGSGEEAVRGPPTELQADLETLFGQCNETAMSLFESIDRRTGIYVTCSRQLWYSGIVIRGSYWKIPSSRRIAGVE